MASTISNRGHLKRLIAKGLIEIKCDQILTDDYAFDAAFNYGKTTWKKAVLSDDRNYVRKENEIVVSSQDFKYGSGYISENPDGSYSWTMLANHYYTVRITADAGKTQPETETPEQKAEVLGAAACKANKMRVPSKDTELMKLLEGLKPGEGAENILKAWHKGYTTEIDKFLATLTD